MRTVFVLLLLANLTLFGYTRLDVGAGGEAVRLAEQIQPDRIKLLTPQEVAALGPAKVAALADVCVEWGPFSDADRGRALAELEPLAIGKLTTQRRVDAAGTWAAMLSPFANRPAADRRASELRQQNVRDVSVIDAPGGRYAIAIGVFRSEDAANAHAADLSRQGIASAAAAQRTQSVTQSLIVVRDPPANVVARLRELQGTWPGAELKVGTCERA
ncbi:hypothetical protein BURK1_00345 [Burkholderiales bacterium]|nr:hypothetical protein BURK1_00345 [Burkholderiales bacterium]